MDAEVANRNALCTELTAVFPTPQTHPTRGMPPHWPLATKTWPPRANREAWEATGLRE